MGPAQQSETPLDQRLTASSLRVTLARIYRALRMNATSTLTPSQSSVLFRVEQSEPVRMGVLADLERIQPASLSRLVDALDAMQLIRRETDPFDGRVTLISVSSEGSQLIARQRAANTETLKKALALLTPEERNVVSAAAPALERLAEIMLTQPESFQFSVE
jgi:DNA-binding MarR family transcriptional regulator